MFKEPLVTLLEKILSILQEYIAFVLIFNHFGKHHGLQHKTKYSICVIWIMLVSMDRNYTHINYCASQ